MTNIDRLFDELFPICRSITGEGIRESLEVFGQHMPLEIKSIPTGTTVFDWTIPKEWTLNRATLIAPDGRLLVDSDDCNLHVLNFSESFSGDIGLQQLQQHLFSLPELPDAIPYVTSYYKERWGLCITQRLRDSLQDGTYRVEIDARKEDGELVYATTDLQGDSDDVFLVSSYLCHPSLANNELSGPLCLLRLYEKLRARRRRRYTYKFVLVPETIGSIAFLAKEGSSFADKVRGGLVLTCLGGDKERVSLKLSRRDWLGNPSAADMLARQLAELDSEAFEIREFTPTSGSDERQYCSPGINLPVLQAAKTIYGEYTGYHNSLDTKDFMGIESVEQSADLLFEFVRLFEYADLTLASSIEGGEPNLGNRELYPTMNSPMTGELSTDNRKDGRYQLNLLLNVLSLLDGTKTIPEIARKLGVSTLDTAKVVDMLVEKDVARFAKMRI